MEGLKSSEGCDKKSNSLRTSIESQSSMEVEVELGQNVIKNETSCVQNRLNTFSNRLPTKNSGFEKNALRDGRTKPQMLGSLTFREITKKRKVMLKNGFVKQTKKHLLNFPSTPKSESSCYSDETDSNKSFENSTTYINPHDLVGKMITLQNGNVRHIKFLSENSNSPLSDKIMLKLDALQLTPKIIVKTGKPGCLFSQQKSVKNKVLEKLNGHITEQLTKVNVIPISKSAPYNVHKVDYSHNSSHTELKKEQFKNKNPERTVQKASSYEDVYHTVENSVGTRGTRRENSNCSPLSSSYDNLTILSQVACSELESKKHPVSKEVANHLASSNGKCVQRNPNKLNRSLIVAHSYDQKPKPVKELHNTLSTGRPKKSEPYWNRGNNLSASSLERNKIKHEEIPMFAWCTQYIKHSKPMYASCSVNQKHKLVPSHKKIHGDFKVLSKDRSEEQPSNQKIHGDFKVLSKDRSEEQPSNQKIHGDFKVLSKDRSEEQPSNQKSGDSLMTNLINFKEPISYKTSHTKSTSGQSSTVLIHEKGVKNDSCEITTNIPVTSPNVEETSKENDEIFIVKEILVSKSLNINAVFNKKFDSSKLKGNNKHCLIATGSRITSAESDKKTSLGHILAGISRNKEQTSGNIPEKNADIITTEINLPTTKVTVENIPSCTEDMKVNKEMIEFRKPQIIPVMNSPPKKIPPKNTPKHQSSTLEKAIKDVPMGNKNYPIKKCFVMVERLPDLESLVRKPTVPHMESDINTKRSKMIIKNEDSKTFKRCPGGPKKIHIMKLNKQKTKTENTKVEEIDYQGKSNNNIDEKQHSAMKNTGEESVSNKESEGLEISPEKTFYGTREIYSLLADFKTIGCKIESKRRLRRSANILQETVDTIENVRDLVDNPMLNEEKNNSGNFDNRLTLNSVVVESQVLSVSNEVIQRNNSSPSAIEVLNSNISSCHNLRMDIPPSNQQNIESPRFKPLVQSKQKNTPSFKKVSKMSNDVRQLKRNNAPLLKRLKLIKSDIENKLENSFKYRNISNKMHSPQPSLSKDNDESNFNNVGRKSATKRNNWQQTSRSKKQSLASKIKVLNSTTLIRPNNKKYKTPKCTNFKKNLCLHNLKRKCPDSIDVALDGKTRHHQANQLSSDCVLSTSSSTESIDKRSLPLNLDKAQEKRVRIRPHLDSQNLQKSQNQIVLNTSDLNCLKLLKEETKTQDNLNEQVSHSSESDSTACVRTQEIPECNLKLNCNNIFGSRSKKLTPVPTCNSSVTNKIQALGVSVKNESSALASPINQTMDLSACINRLVSEGKSNLSCGSSNSSLGQKKIEPTNNQMTKQSSANDKIRLLIIKQLMKSKRCHQKFIKNVHRK